MEYVLRTNAVKKEYGNYKALNGLTMNVPEGGIYGFVGKNGSGKTTLIRLACGLQKPTDGEMEIYGVSYTDKAVLKARRRMGAVVETPSVYLNMTAEDNIKEQCRILGLPTCESIPEILRLVGLENTGKKKAKNFSLGMRQRLGIAVALTGNPDFLILDEPINGLDPQGIVEIRELILNLNRRHGITVLVSSHYLDELSKIATHFGFIDGGRIVKEMSAKELESACRKRVEITVSDTKALSRVLDGFNAEYSLLSDTEAEIFGEVNVTELALKLYENRCTVHKINERNESLEAFYIDLVGGERQ